MILPSKHLGEDRALLHVGAEILALLDEPKTVSRLWAELKGVRTGRSETSSLTYDWFVLALDLLYALEAVELNQGRIEKRTQ